MKTRYASLTILALAAALSFTSCGDKKKDNPAPASDGVGNGSGTLTIGSSTYNLTFTQAQNSSGQLGGQGAYSAGIKAYTIQIMVYNGTDPGTGTAEYTVAEESSGAVYAEAIISESNGTVGTTRNYRAPDGTKIKFSVVNGKNVLSVPVTTMQEIVSTGTGGTLSAGGSVAWQ